MGIKNLKYLINKYAADCIKQKSFAEYKNKIIAIDISIYFYQFIYKQTDPIELFVKQALKFLKNGVIPLYVFDGKPPKEKNYVLNERNERKKDLMDKKDKIIEQINTSGIDQTLVLKNELEKLQKQIIFITSKNINDCKLLFEFMGIPYIVANGEAEILCAKLSCNGLVYGSLSEDTDILANGGKYFIRGFNVNSNKLIEYNLDKLLELLDIDYDKFIDICILCGCDYSSSIKNIGVERAYKFIKKCGNIEGVLDFIADENDKLVKMGKKSRYIVPDTFNYQKARKLFKIEENYNEFNDTIKISKPQIDKLLSFLDDRVNLDIKNEIKNNLENYYNDIINIKTKQTTILDFCSSTT